MLLQLEPTLNGHIDPDSDGHSDAWEHPRDRLNDPTGLPIQSLQSIIEDYPRLRPPLIDGLLRQGETANLIAAPKVGKSWLTYGLGISVAIGRPWLDTLTTTPGRVLLIDNELHPETIAHRIPKVTSAMGVPLAEVRSQISIMPLRGRLMDLRMIANSLSAVASRQILLIVVDAFYRTLPKDTDENDNGAMAQLYNLVDQMAAETGASVVMVHHTTKGNQSAKSITDVGAGAGAQSRAADTHIVLRSHAETDVVVMEANVRSFPPLAPLCLRWNWPTWTPAPELDPAALRTEANRRRGRKEAEPEKETAPTWDSRRFAEKLGKPEPQPESVIIENAVEAGLSDRKAKQHLKTALDRKLLFSWKEGKAKLIASVAPVEKNRARTPPTPPVTAKGPYGGLGKRAREKSAVVKVAKAETGAARPTT